jgi:tetratricopeptide (TPR) repeat protein
MKPFQSASELKKAYDERLPPPLWKRMVIAGVVLVLVLLIVWLREENRARKAVEEQWQIVKNESDVLLEDNLIIIRREINEVHGLSGRLVGTTPPRQPHGLKLLKERLESLKQLVEKIKATSSRLPEEHLVELRIAEAVVLIAEGQQEEALRLLPEADAKVAPDAAGAKDREVTVWRVRACAFLAGRNWKEAQETYKKILILCPDDTRVLCDIGDCLYALGRDTEGASCYEQVIRDQRGRVEAEHEDPAGLAELLTRHGHALRVSRQGGEATAKFDEAIKIFESLIQGKDRKLHFPRTSDENRG